MMNTPHETTLLAAADRLRRLQVDSRDYIYFWHGDALEGIKQDRATLADAMLRAIPAGPEPVAIDWDADNCPRGGTVVWCINSVGILTWSEADRASGFISSYSTEADARLALAWKNFRLVFSQSDNSA